MATTQNIYKDYLKKVLQELLLDLSKWFMSFLGIGFSIALALSGVFLVTLGAGLFQQSLERGFGLHFDWKVWSARVMHWLRQDPSIPMTT